MWLCLVSAGFQKVKQYLFRILSAHQLLEIFKE